MPVSNAEIAANLGQVADLMEIQGENPLRIRAIRQAVERGTVDLLEKLHRKMPGEPGRLLEVAGLGPKRVDAAGSSRRGRETVGDLDILAVGDDPAALVESFVACDGAGRVTARGGTKAALVLRSGLQVDLRFIPEGRAAAAGHWLKERRSGLKCRRS